MKSTIHYTKVKSLAHYNTAACGTEVYYSYLVNDPSKVTCKNCMRTKVYKEAIKNLNKELEMEKSYEDRQAEWVEKNNVKVGDKVIIARACTESERSFCVDEINSDVERAAFIRDILSWGIDLEGDFSRIFPYTMLDKVKTTLENRPALPKGTKIKYSLCSQIVQYDRGGTGRVVQCNEYLWLWSKYDIECKIVSWPSDVKIPEWYKDKFENGFPYGVVPEYEIPEGFGEVFESLKKVDYLNIEPIPLPYSPTMTYSTEDYAPDEDMISIFNKIFKDISPVQFLSLSKNEELLEASFKDTISGKFFRVDIVEMELTEIAEY